MAGTRWALRIVRQCAVATVRVFFLIRITIGMLGAVGGLLALLFSLIFVVLSLFSHGGGNALGGLGGGQIVHGNYYLFSHGREIKVTMFMFWAMWITQLIMFSGGGSMALMFAIEGLVWLAGGESYVWGRRRCSDPDGEGTKFNDNG